LRINRTPNCSIFETNAGAMAVFNAHGAIVLFKFVKNNDIWTIDFSHNIYYNGLQEIIEKHLKDGNNSV